MAENVNLGRIFLEIRAEQDRLKKDLAEVQRTVERSAERQETAMRRAWRNAGNFIKTQAKAIGGFVAGAFAVDALARFGRKIVDTAKEFEFLQTRLQSYFKTQKEANEAFEEFVTLAATSPFSLREITEAAATLEAFGISSRKSLIPVQDLAAFMGRDLVDAASAVGRAFAGGIGAADILRETGVINRILTATGKTVQDFSKDIEGFRKAIFETIADPNQGITGSAERLSRTLTGAFSNLGDAFDNFANALGRGASPGIIRLVQGLTDLLERLTPVESGLEKVKREALDQRIAFETLFNTYKALAQQSDLTATQQKLLAETLAQLNTTFSQQRLGREFTKDLQEAERAAAAVRSELSRQEGFSRILAEQRDLTRNIVELEQREVELSRELAEARARNSEETRKSSEFAASLAGRLTETKGIESRINRVRNERISLQKQLNDFEKENSVNIRNALALETQITEEVKKRAAIIPRAQPAEARRTPLEVAPEIGTGQLEAQLNEAVRITQEKQREIATIANDISAAFVDGFLDIRIEVSETASFIEKAFANLANAVINQVKRMTAQWLAFLAIRSAAGLFGLAAPNPPAFLDFFGGGGLKVAAPATGGSLIGNSSPPNIVSPGDVGGTRSVLNRLSSQLAAGNTQRAIQVARDPRIEFDANLQSEIEGTNIVLSYDRTNNTRRRNG